MSKNKLAKLLLAIGLGVATATTTVGLVACSNDQEQEQEQTYTVTFDLNYTGATGAPGSETLKSGEKVTEPTEPTRDGYTFDGWYTSDGKKWTFGTDTVTSNLTLKAHWTQNGTTPPPATEPTSITATKTTTTYTLSSGSATIVVSDITVNPNQGTLDGWTTAYSLKKGDTEVSGNGPWTVTEAGTYTLTVTVTKGSTTLTAAAITITVNAESSVNPPPATDDAPKAALYIGEEKKGEVTCVQHQDGDWYIDTAPTAIEDDDSNTEFSAWCTDANCTTVATFPLKYESGLTLYAKFLENVTSSVDFTAEKNANSAVRSETFYMGKVEVRNPSGDTKLETSASVDCLKWAGGDIYFTVGGEENSVTLQARGASSSGAGIKLYKVTQAATEETSEVLSEVLVQWGGSTTSGAWIPATGTGDSASAVDLTKELDKGEYKLVRMNNVRISKFVITEKLPKGTPVSITATGATQHFVVGDEFNSNGLNLKLNYNNGRVDVITPTSIVSSAYNKEVSGAYTITVKYTYAKTNTELETEYTVYVYKVDDIVIGTDRISDDTQSAAGNTNYFNEATQEFYFTNDTINTNGISVALQCSVEGMAEQTHTFYDRDYTAALKSGDDMTTAGEKTVVISSYEKTKEYKIYVAEKPDLTGTKSVKINVNSATTAGNIGAIDNDAYQFKTIQQALDFLEMLDLDINVKKTITLAAERYNEKVEVTIPNLTIKGTTSGDQRSIIEYDALFGMLDPSGYTYTTDSTATLAVRDTAEGFILDNVVVNNMYSTQDYFDEKLGEGYNEHRALAVLIMADKVIIQNCEFNGYQDTIELFTGRQLIKNTLITGLTDFIFGTNNTTYFDNCEIRTIKAARNSSDQDKPHGGYITAFKGNNKNDNDAVKYGAIFVGCRFTAEDGVADNLMAIARPWGKYAKVAVIESTLGKHIAKVSSGTQNQDERYVTMNGTSPTLSTVEFYEYNNTGDGALTPKGTVADTENDDLLKTEQGEVAGMRFLTATGAAKYKDKSIIFGTTNGKVTYKDTWSGEAIEFYTLTIKAADEEQIYTSEIMSGEFYSKSKLTSLVPAEKYPSANVEGNTVRIKGFYTDKEGASEYQYDKAVSANVDLYVIFEEVTPPRSEVHQLEVPSEGSWAANTNIGDDEFFMVIANNGVKETKIEGIKNGNSSYKKNGKELTFTHQFSLTSGGIKSATTGHGLGFTIPEGKTAKVTVYAASKNANVALTIYNGSDKQDITDLKIDGAAADSIGVLPITTNSVTEYSFTIEESGTIGIGGSGGGAYIYGLIVEILGD